MTCVVKGCGNYSSKTKKTAGSKIKYFTFPKNPEIAEEWHKACGKDVNFQTGNLFVYLRNVLFILNYILHSLFVVLSGNCKNIHPILAVLLRSLGVNLTLQSLSDFQIGARNSPYDYNKVNEYEYNKLIIIK